MWSRQRGFLNTGALSPPGGDSAPIRAELFSGERLAQHAESLAAAQIVGAGRGAAGVHARLRDNERFLLEAYRALSEAVRLRHGIVSGGEWLLDNFHIVESQIEDIRDHLPASYYRELPKLAAGFLAGYPRAYGIAWALAAHTDSRFSPEQTTAFVSAYQRVAPLTLGELWAIATSLRVVLIENLRRLAEQIVCAQHGRRMADELVDHALVEAADPAEAFAHAKLPSTPHRRAFVVQLVQRLRDPHPGAIPSLSFIDEWLAAEGLSLDDLVAREHSEQVAASLSVRNVITSLRAIAAFDWRRFVEDVSLVNEILRDTAGYEALDFLTRNRYRNAVEELARHSRKTEWEVARAVAATVAGAGESPAKEAEAGFHLIGAGRFAFERGLGFRPTLRRRLLRFYVHHAVSAYLGSIALLAILALAVPLAAGQATGLRMPTLVLLGAVALIPASDIAVGLVNRLITRLLPPRHLPRLELAEGVPTTLRTMVVVPTILRGPADAAEQVAQLETHYLSNPEGDVYFALLSDWRDADSEQLPDDEEVLAAAVDGIRALNDRYLGGAAGARFHLFHRRRLWNARQQRWMGWERKRGKLCEFNRLLRGDRQTTFLQSSGMPPADVRYVITLDADTKLPMGAVRALVATAAHPLNRPVLSADGRRVVAGYGIFQPRITPTLPRRTEYSVFQRVISRSGGMDPYAGAISDVYQDLFGEGSYTGKGLYDVDAFMAALADRVPENAVLSHDLLEGIYARCALAGDIELFEETPYHASVAASRSHRWIRGDWQLLPWIVGSRGRDLPAIGRWKMIDNLRRSLSAPGVFCTAVLAWALPLAPSATLLLFALFALSLPVILAVTGGLWPRRAVPLSDHLRAVRSDMLWGAGHSIVSVVLLGQRTWLTIDAVSRTLWRILVSRRHLLDWVTAAQQRDTARLTLGHFALPLWGTTAGSLFAGGLVLAFNPAGLPGIAPLLAVWWLAPVFALLFSRTPRPDPLEARAPEDAATLRLVGRRTWRFFDTFVTADTHWLPPDNFQEDPQPVIARRTSPSNIGLYLLSVVAARDFGWLGLLDARDRIESTLDTLDRLPRMHGHLYNWYDTDTLEPLEPRYVSAVDSGNLAGHLITLAQACRDALDRGVDPANGIRGLGDTHRLLVEALETLSGDGPSTVTPDMIRVETEAFRKLLAATGTGGGTWSALYRRLDEQAETLCDMTATLATALEEGSRVHVWAAQLRADARSHLRDLEALLPATGAAGDTPDPGQEETVDAVPDGRGQPGEQGREQALRPRGPAAAELGERLRALAHRAETLSAAMDFRFLYHPDRHLFSLGYRVNEGELDSTCYDLLGSEARLTSLVAIAWHSVSSAHWFHLGRRLTRAAKGAVLLSWSGSMFEYLMPSLVCYTPRYSLLDQTCRLVVKRQIEYGRERGVPWGISESAYNVRDLNFNYQYSAFGIPGLGMKRGLGQDLVIAPYATALAAMYYPHLAVENFARLQENGALGHFGYYEALDYTPARLDEGQDVAVVRCYMAHHQGMSLVALGNAVHDGLMRHRFHAAPRIRAVELLLQERVPREADTSRPLPGQGRIERAQLPQPPARREPSPYSLRAATHLLGNGRYAVMVTAAGAGYSVCGDQAVTRWREDATRDCWGSFLYLRDVASGAHWSAGFQPTRVRPDEYEAVFLEDRVRIARRDGKVRSVLEIVVSPEDDVEIRRLSLANIGARPLELEVTSYAEIVLAPLAADIAHPAFSNLFVRTEYLPASRALLATRRRRDERDPEQWAAHVVCGRGIGEGIQYETDRARFLGRGRSPADPVAVRNGAPLSNTVGAVLDPIFSLRVRVLVQPGATTHLSFATIVADSREAVEDLADKYHDPSAFDRASALAWTHSSMKLHHLRISHDDAQVYQEVANRLLFADGISRARPSTLARNRTDVTGLWKHGISGDRPIVLVSVSDDEHRPLVAQLLSAREYLGLKCMPFDLVILNEESNSYVQMFQDSLIAAVDSSRRLAAPVGVDVGDGVFLLRRDQLTEDDLILLQTAARLVVAGDRGSLFQQLVGRRRKAPPPVLAQSPEADEAPAGPGIVPRLDFYNGTGGLSGDGTEYVIVLDRGQWTPAPWVNVVANERFGFTVSETGAGFTWCGNSRENQLTPWSNDPVQDPCGEALYLRDDDTGAWWTPTPLPVRLPTARYQCRHGQGYSRFEHESHGIHSDLVQFVVPDDPVKVSMLTLKNTSNRRCRLTVTAYVEWVLAASRSVSAPYVVTEVDEASAVLFARNPWNTDFGRRVAFLHLGGRDVRWTGNRREFIGRNRDLAAPAAVADGVALRGHVGAGLDPCGAMQTRVVLEPGGQVRLVVLLGQGSDREEAADLANRYRDADHSALFDSARRHWDDILTRVEIGTPDPGLDALVNRWLLYQTLSCRMWGRAGFYQVGGAFGFRDQLQDSMALVLAAPQETRRHLLRAAGRQFPEGDVQHWWHPPSGRGVRTRFADDRIWLAFCLTHYVTVTGDRGVLEEEVTFLEGPELEPDQEDAHYQPERSNRTASVYEHAALALDASLGVGVHGLPLMGGGDWNDGMNHVGHGGRGESVWLAWFLIATLGPFADIAHARGDEERAKRWRRHASELTEAAERHGWDGAWYRRAYFDDGTPLGAATSPECRIDSIAQSWSVISGAAPRERAQRAMDSVFEHLVRYGEELVLLFTPPFEETRLDPGYIKGYPPGVRENGGQYTHAAIWCVVACAMLGEGDRAGDLLRILNPLNRASSRTGAYAYKVEPYAIAADIYAEPPHARRGGWTWYTGAAGWFYRAATESVLGLHVEGDRLRMQPCVPSAWPAYRIRYRHGRRTEYVIDVVNPESVSGGVVELTLDGRSVEPAEAVIPLVDDGASHRVRVVLGRSPRSGHG